MESEIKFTISILEFHLPSWGPCFRGPGLSALWVCETRGRVTFLSAPTSTISTHLSHTHGWWPTLGTQTHSLQMSAIAFSFQKIPSAFSIAASPVTSLHDQWPHTFSQFSLPLGTSGELCCGSHICVAQPEVFKGCSKGHNPQHAAVNYSILVPPARGPAFSQSFNWGRKSVYNSGAPC